MDQNQLRDELLRLLDRFGNEAQASSGNLAPRIDLSCSPYENADIAEAILPFVSGWPTIGPKTREVEDRFADKYGFRNAVMVASGGGANLLTFLLLASQAYGPRRLQPGDEVITPAVTWMTTTSPILAVGCKPVFVDVHLETLATKASEIERALSDKTRALMLVHPLGNTLELEPIQRLADENDLILIEDTCEAIGASYQGKPVGSFGDLATFSFYFSHHVTSIEGGIIVTDDDGHADMLRSMRNNGWHREIRNPQTADKMKADNPGIDPTFLFPYLGFNFKPTDVGSALLLGQLDRLEERIERRRVVTEAMRAALKPFERYIHPYETTPGGQHSCFAFPIVVRSDAPFQKRDLVEHLTEWRIASRPIISGNIVEQPFLEDFDYRALELPNSELVGKNGFFLGCHEQIGEAELDLFKEAVDEFAKARGLDR